MTTLFNTVHSHNHFTLLLTPLFRGDGRFKSILIRSRYDVGFDLNAISTKRMVS